MCRCIPRTYSKRYNHLSLGMSESSPYSSTNMRLSRSYSILPVHMICIVLTCIIIAFICLGFTFFSFIRLFSWFLLLLLLSLINSKQQKYFLLFCFFVWFLILILYGFLLLVSFQSFPYCSQHVQVLFGLWSISLSKIKYQVLPIQLS